MHVLYPFYINALFFFMSVKHNIHTCVHYQHEKSVSVIQKKKKMLKFLHSPSSCAALGRTLFSFLST